MNLEKLCKVYDDLYSKMSTELKKAGYYDKAIVDELSGGLVGKLKKKIDDTYLPFIEYVTKDKRQYDCGFSAKNLLNLLQTRENALPLVGGMEAPLALMTIYLVDGKILEAEYFFARDGQEADNKRMCELGYIIGIGCCDYDIYTLKHIVHSSVITKTVWKKSPLDSSDSSSSDKGNFVIEKGVLKKYKGKESDVIIPDTVTSIGEEAFKGCKKIKSVTIGKSVTTIGKYAFYECTALSKVILPDTLKRLGVGAFKYCSSLVSIEIPVSVKSISGDTFKHCTSLKEVLLPDTITGIGDSAFCDTNLQKIVLPKSLTRISAGAFYNCSMTKIEIPSLVEKIGYNAFTECYSLKNIEVDENNNVYKSIDGNLYTKDGNTLMLFATGKQQTTFTVPDCVTRVGDYAFYGSLIETIVIPNTVTSIGTGAFKNCSKLQKVLGGESIENIEGYAFQGCQSLYDINISKSLSHLGNGVFHTCETLESITLPNALKELGYSVFEGCNSLAIYCEHKRRPPEWDEKWNEKDWINHKRCRVVWGYKG